MITAAVFDTKPYDREPLQQASANFSIEWRFLEYRPIRARRPTLTERAAKWSRRHRTVVVSAVMFLTLATTGLGLSTVLIAREQAEVLRQRDQARTQRDERRRP